MNHVTTRSCRRFQINLSSLCSGWVQIWDVGKWNKQEYLIWHQIISTFSAFCYSGYQIRHNKNYERYIKYAFFYIALHCKCQPACKNKKFKFMKHTFYRFEQHWIMMEESWKKKIWVKRNDNRHEFLGVV